MRLAAVITGVVVAALVVVLALARPAGEPDPQPGGRAAPGAGRERTPDPAATPERRRRLARARCAPAADNCAAATGRVIYVEAVDPDGDGDAHYVIAGGSVTAPGLTVIDVARDLRPRRLARPGDLVSAAGPVYTGSHGQHQIQATEIHQRRR